MRGMGMGALKRDWTALDEAALGCTEAIHRNEEMGPNLDGTEPRVGQDTNGRHGAGGGEESTAHGTGRNGTGKDE